MPGLLEFRPIIKRIRWGGTRLSTLLDKPTGGASDAAESWEVADHGADQSVVVSGPWSGAALSELVRLHGRELLGRHAGLTQFPLLVKFLDAADRLSLQVHPDDAQAKRYNPQENGKTEAWVIVAADRGAKLYAGLNAGIDRAALERHLAEGAVEACLHSFAVAPGDCVFIPAGTVHAIGEGVLLAEIQQSSDLTFRLFDWGRLGADGKPRPVHVAESLDCTDFARGPVDRVTPRPLGWKTFSAGGNVHEELVRCGHFAMQRHTAILPFALPDDDRFHVLMALDGSARLYCGSEGRPLLRGQTLLATAAREPLRIEPVGRVTLLDAFLP